MNKLILKLKNKAAEMYVSKVVWTLAVIIIGMLLMWGIHFIMDNNVLPGLQDNIESIFTNADEAADAANGTPSFGYNAAP